MTVELPHETFKILHHNVQGFIMRLLYDLKCKINLSKNALIFIKRYQKIYKQVIYAVVSRY